MANTEQSLTPCLIFSIFAATIGCSFVFGYSMGVINAPSELIQAWIQNESYPYLHGTVADDSTLLEIWSWTVAIVFVGGCFGGLGCGFAADKLGRKGAMLANNTLTLIACLLMGISKSTNLYPLLMVGRFITGVSCGMCSALPAMYLTEIAPLKFRGIIGSVHPLIIILGVFTSQLLGLAHVLGTEQLWPLLLSLSAIPCIVQLCTLTFCPESPRYLLVKGKREEARAALVRIRKTENVDEELNGMLDDSSKQPIGSPESAQTRSKSSSAWWGIVVCMVNHIAQQTSGINAVLSFSTTIFVQQAQMSSQGAVEATLGTGLVLFLGALVSTVTMDRFGRRFFMMIGMIGVIVANFLIFVTLHLLAIDFEKYSVAADFAVIFVYVFIIMFAIGPSGIPWFYTSELAEPSQKAKLNTIATVTNWGSAFIVGFTFLPLMEIMNEYIFLLYAVLVVLCLIFFFLYAPETKGKECAEVAIELESRKPKCLRRDTVEPSVYHVHVVQ